ncbi:MAG: family four-helix-bundle protein [Mucilaginibacter sp.]|nr:family four-helix-bundle protein [Mucilaginibacter sp.]
MENTAKTIEILNDLILINNDRIEGYERALKEIEESGNDTELQPLFLRFIDESRRYRVELGTEVGAFGKDMITGTSTGGKIHRAWITVKETFTGHDRHSLLEECEFGEDAIKKAYEEALNEEVLASYIREMLMDQEEELIEAHDEIKNLRDRVE